MSKLRDRILNADDQQTEVVPVPEWGKDIKVEMRGLTAGGRGVFLGAQAEAGGRNKFDHEHYMVDLVVATAYDPETGDKLFTMADRDTLTAKSGAAIQRLADKATELSGLNRREDAKEVLEPTRS